MNVLRTLLLALLMLHAQLPLAAGVDFEQQDIDIGHLDSVTVLTGRLLDGGLADIALVHLDDQGNAHLRILSFNDGAWLPTLEALLGPGVLFVDVLEDATGARLITYQHGSISAFDTASGELQQLVAVNIGFNADPSARSFAGTGPMQASGDHEVPRLDVSHDLNGDGLDDLVLPSVAGFWLAAQRPDGSFDAPKRLGPPEPFRDAVAFDDTRSYGEVGINALTLPWYLTRVHTLDQNGDGRDDLVFWNTDHFEVHLQGADGRFAAKPLSVATEAPFDADGPYGLVFGLAGRDDSGASLVLGTRERQRFTVLVSLRDVNGDGIGDLTTQTVEGRSILRMDTRFQVHFGELAQTGVLFSQEPDITFVSGGRAGGMQHSGYSSLWLQDFDGDGRVELMLGEVSIGFGAMLRAMMGTSITLISEIFTVDGATEDGSAVRRRFKSDIDTRGGRDGGFFPAVVTGDVNGDGRTDLLLGKHRGELHVYLGETGPGMLTETPVKLSVELPGDERNTWLTDLNGDARQDIVLQHPAGEEPGRLTLLVSR